MSSPMPSDDFRAAAADASRAAQRQLADERAANRQRQVDALLQRAAIPGRYKGAAICPIAQAQEQAYAVGAEFVAEFERHRRDGSGLLLWGDVGTGKTHLACAIGNALIGQMRAVMYCTALEAVTLVKSTWRRAGMTEGVTGMTEYDVYDRFGAPELLILDEIGVQCGTEFERVVLSSIADIRSRNCLPTIAVTNLAPGEVFDLLGERMFDRLVGFGATVVHMPGQSLRVRRHD